jgi:hypothetical protein
MPLPSLGFSFLRPDPLRAIEIQRHPKGLEKERGVELREARRQEGTVVENPNREIGLRREG